MPGKQFCHSYVDNIIHSVSGIQLRLACDKLMICCISTGEFHFPQEKAAEIAVQTVVDFLQVDKRIKKGYP